MKTPLHRIRLGAFSLAMVVLVSITGYRFFGGYDWLEAIWMVVITISTVGYMAGFSGRKVARCIEEALLSRKSRYGEME